MRRIAGRYGHDALLVPSARHDSGTNLVISPQNLAVDEFQIVNEEVIAADTRF